ncbi:MAG: hypothetical protein FJX67_17810, partial [Alphaproteobacteria bacterium]|nr:hypothetical protein [Alphaproteobacteria bacterium]
MQGGAERPVLAALVAAAFLAAAAPAGAKGPQARPGALNAEPATFHALGVRWIIHDDDNANARIEVAFRKAGESAWRAAMPLFRPPKEYQSPHNRIADGLMFAGSIVDLEPGTRYDVRLWLIDPDGVDQTRTLQMATRAEPVAPAPLCTLHVRPDGGGARGAGSEGDP